MKYPSESVEVSSSGILRVTSENWVEDRVTSTYRYSIDVREIAEIERKKLKDCHTLRLRCGTEPNEDEPSECVRWDGHPRSVSMDLHFPSRKSANEFADLLARLPPRIAADADTGIADAAIANADPELAAKWDRRNRQCDNLTSIDVLNKEKLERAQKRNLTERAQQCMELDLELAAADPDFHRKRIDYLLTRYETECEDSSNEHRCDFLNQMLELHGEPEMAYSLFERRCRADTGEWRRNCESAWGPFRAADRGERARLIDEWKDECANDEVLACRNLGYLRKKDVRPPYTAAETRSALSAWQKGCKLGDTVSCNARIYWYGLWTNYGEGFDEPERQQAASVPYNSKNPPPGPWKEQYWCYNWRNHNDRVVMSCREENGRYVNRFGPFDPCASGDVGWRKCEWSSTGFAE